MQFVPWAAALVASIVAGVSACRALVARRRLIGPLIALSITSLAAAGIACHAIWAATGRLDLLIAVVALSCGSSAGGYALGAATLAAHAPRRRHVSPTQIAAATTDLHVIVLADEEPDDYDPAAVTAGLARFDDGEIDVPPEIARPLIYASERARYRRAGGSPARTAVRAIAASLETRLRERGVAHDVSAAFCIGGPSLAEAVATVVTSGGRRIVVAPLAAAWSQAFTDAVEDLPAAALAAAGVSVEVAGPLWPSPHLSAMVAQRTLSNLGGDRTADGIVLVSEGDPWEHAKVHDVYREQITFLIQRVRAELIHAGVAADRIRRAWLWLEEPDIAEAVRHLVAVGARNVVVVPVTFPVETLATLVDLRYAGERATAETGAKVTVVAPWGGDPAVVEALVDTVAEAAQRFDPT